MVGVDTASVAGPLLPARDPYPALIPPSFPKRLKCLYLVTRSLDPTGHGRARWAMRWEPALNAFSITFTDRFPDAETLTNSAGNTVSEIVPPEGSVAPINGVTGSALCE